MTTSPVLVVDDDALMRDALTDALAALDCSVLTADNGNQALEILANETVGLVVTDWHMQPLDGVELLGQIRSRYPGMPAVLMTAHGSIENAVEVMRSGASDYLVKPFEADALKAVIDKYLAQTIDVDEGPIAADPETAKLLKIAERVAKTNVTVTISGPSGSGKEVFARYIHDCSPREKRPFVAINCAAIPESMLEAVLFGHEKGAFTGANGAHAGKFEQANGGTLLLDEISEMDLGLQAKLLRVIQEKEVERIGATKTIPLDVRVLATTNRDLKRYVAEGRFREDLYYRLNVFPLHVPALAERRGDIIPLAELTMARHGSPGISLTKAAENLLLAHDWPGNVRELENLIQRSLILLSGAELDAADLAFEAGTESSADNDLSEGLRNHEFQLIVDALKAHNGKRAAVAETLGISARSLRYKLARMRAAGVAIPGEST
ncbi:MAG: sigma-54 dependent transcriptional regulator [Pseudomonadota bacterium]